MRELGLPGSPIASFYLGATGSANVEYINVLAKYPRQTGWAFHGGDSWRLTPKLNVSYSMRWDYITPFVDKKNNLSFIDPIGGNPEAVTASGAKLPDGLLSQERSLEQLVTVHVILRFRSRRAGVLGSGLPTPSTTKPLFARDTGSTSDRRSILAGEVGWRRMDSIRISP